MTGTEPSSIAAVRAAMADLAPDPTGESIDLDPDRSRGRILHRPLVADRDQPPFDRATMDGFAVRAADVVSGATLRVVGEASAGRPHVGSIGPGDAVRIATGAAVPEAMDAVVERERVSERDDGTVRIDDLDVAAGRSIHPRGVDAAAGSVLVRAGSVVDDIAVGIAATIGAATLEVRTRPRVIVISTGDELRGVQASLEREEDRFLIRNGNGPMVAAAVQRMGGRIVDRIHVEDDRTSTIAAFRDAVERSDLVVTIGGVSVGDRDHVPEAWSRLGFERGNQGVRLHPGRPFAWWPRDDGGRAVGLPGNPVSALVTAHLFVRCWIEAGLGLDPEASWREVRLDGPVRRNPHRPMARPATLRMEGGEVRATVPVWQGSGDLAHLAGTDGVVMIDHGDAEAAAGSIVRFLPW